MIKWIVRSAALSVVAFGVLVAWSAAAGADDPDGENPGTTTTTEPALPVGAEGERGPDDPDEPPAEELGDEPDADVDAIVAAAGSGRVGASGSDDPDDPAPPDDSDGDPEDPPVVQRVTGSVGEGGSATVEQTFVLVEISSESGNPDGGSGPAAAVETGGAEVSAGPATALGSSSDVDATQDIVLSVGAGASATLTQTTVVLDVGVAVAVSGLNVAMGGPGTEVAVVATGASGATGNTSTTQVEQRVAVSVSDGGAVSVDQVTEVTNAGIALAASGVNVALGAASVTTGDSVAVGNDAVTKVRQTVSYSGTSGAFTQTVAVSNSGTALASSGFNVAMSAAWATTTVSVAGGEAMLEPLMVWLRDLLRGAWGAADVVRLDMRAAESTSANGGLTVVQRWLVVRIRLGAPTPGAPVLDLPMRVANDAEAAVALVGGQAAITTGGATATGNRAVTKVCQDIPVLAAPCFPDPVPVPAPEAAPAGPVTDAGTPVRADIAPVKAAFVPAGEGTAPTAVADNPAPGTAEVLGTGLAARPLTANAGITPGAALAATGGLLLVPAATGGVLLVLGGMTLLGLGRRRD